MLQLYMFEGSTQNSGLLRWFGFLLVPFNTNQKWFHDFQISYIPKHGTGTSLADHFPKAVQVPSLVLGRVYSVPAAISVLWSWLLSAEVFASNASCETGEILCHCDGFLMALDLSKAYDRLNPLVTAALLETASAGLKASGFWLLCGRWIHLQHVHAEAVAPVMPQGDPLGPLVMTLWM